MNDEEVRQKATKFMNLLKEKLSPFYLVEFYNNTFGLSFKVDNDLCERTSLPSLSYNKDDIVISIWSCNGWEFGGIYYMSINKPGNIDFVSAVLRCINDIIDETKENIEIGIGFEYN